MNRVRCAQLVKDRLTANDIVVCGLGSVEAAYKQVGPAGPTYFASDPMGLWASIALGLALARPDRRVVLLSGDGDLLMNLQVLATIAAVAPTNLRIVLFQNGTYASSGGQSLAGGDNLSFATIAKGSGIAWAAESRTEDETVTALDELFSRVALGFLAVHLERDLSPGEQPGQWSQVEERAHFMRLLMS
jgi:thiamine pyrophosphate-dependent acetolactate synthase large subunit-like protein